METKKERQAHEMRAERAEERAEARREEKREERAEERAAVREAEKKAARKPLFTTKLILRSISPGSLRYRSEDPKAMGWLNAMDMELARTADFPNDPDFNLDFMGKDISSDRKAKQDMVDKQTAFRKFQVLTLTISQ